MKNVAVVIMAKAPIPGLAKTRLIPLLGEAGAAHLQARLLQRAVISALAADLGSVQLWATPDPLHPDIAACQDIGTISVHTQVSGDLGQRMQWAMAKTQAHAADACLVIGTDCPVLTPALLGEAAALLKRNDAVLIPAEDGGYVLIGMRRMATEVFAGIDWGSDKVLAQTRERFAALGWRWVELETLWDVDTADDFRRLRSRFPEMTVGLADAGASA